MDLYPGRDMFESFCNYQKALLAEFDRLSAEYHFETVDASPDAKDVFSLLKTRVLELLASDSRWRRAPRPSDRSPKKDPSPGTRRKLLPPCPI